MRKYWILAVVLALALTACGSADSGETTLPSAPIPTATDTNAAPTVGETGRARLAYTGNTSSVRYVTSPDHLPDVEGLEGYDEAYFQNKALLLVTESVPSGSMVVDIESIIIDDGTAVITLSHQMQGDAGTTDMATWLVWAEVDAGMNYTWTIANPMLKTEAVTE